MHQHLGTYTLRSGTCRRSNGDQRHLFAGAERFGEGSEYLLVHGQIIRCVELLSLGRSPFGIIEEGLVLQWVYSHFPIERDAFSRS